MDAPTAGGLPVSPPVTRRAPPRAYGLKETTMIDDPRKTDLLLSMLTEALPIEAHISQYLASELMEKKPDVTIPKKCNVVKVFYTGDMGGILCGLDIGGAEAKTAHVVSITHLTFDLSLIHI